MSIMAGHPDWCIHYTGIMGPITEGPDHLRRCEAGVLYRSVRVDETEGVSRRLYPCMDVEATTCDKRVWPTPEQLAEAERELEEHINRLREDLANNRCPHCHQSVTKKVQVGPCIYAEPCGHRLGQGRLR